MRFSSGRRLSLVFDELVPPSEHPVPPVPNLPHRLRKLGQDAVEGERPRTSRVAPPPPAAQKDLEHQERIEHEQRQAESPGKRRRDDCKSGDADSPDPVAPRFPPPDA